MNPEAPPKKASSRGSGSSRAPTAGTSTRPNTSPPSSTWAHPSACATSPQITLSTPPASPRPWTAPTKPSCPEEPATTASPDQGTDTPAIPEYGGAVATKKITITLPEEDLE